MFSNWSLRLPSSLLLGGDRERVLLLSSPSFISSRKERIDVDSIVWSCSSPSFPETPSSRRAICDVDELRRDADSNFDNDEIPETDSAVLEASKFPEPVSDNPLKVSSWDCISSNPLKSSSWDCISSSSITSMVDTDPSVLQLSGRNRDKLPTLML